MLSDTFRQKLLASRNVGIVLLCLMLPASAQSEPSSERAAASGLLPVVAAQLSLPDALRLADRNNIGLEQARVSSESAIADVERTRAALSPSISTTTYATTGNEASIVTSAPGVMPQNIFGVPGKGFADQNLMLMVPLATGGSLQKLAAGAASAAQGSLFDLAAGRLQVHEAVAKAYLDVVMQYALVAAAQARITAEQEQVRITQEKVNTGRLAPVDLLREQAELADAQSSAAQAVANSDLALVDLKSAIGISQTSTITLTDNLDTLAAASGLPTPTNLADAIQTALTIRPEIAAAGQRVDAAMSQVRAARGQYSPQLYAVGMADAMAGQSMHSQTGYTVGLAASLPLYDGGARKADVDSATAMLDRVRADARAAQQAVESSVAQAWFTLQSAQQQVFSAQAGLTAAQQGYSLANLRYNAGKSTTAERLDALSALTRAQGNLAQVQAQVVVARIRLFTALGQDANSSRGMY